MFIYDITSVVCLNWHKSHIIICNQTSDDNLTYVVSYISNIVQDHAVDDWSDRQHSIKHTILNMLVPQTSDKMSQQ